MTHTTRKPYPLTPAVIAGAALLALGACSEAAEDTVEPITIIGSSTVYPFAQKVASQVVAANEGFAAPDITSTGSSEGVEEFCKGQGPTTADIVNASRRMRFIEFNRCQNAGVTDIIEIKIGRDGIVFATDLEKGFAFDLTPATLYNALAANPFGEAQEATNWSDVDDALPNEPILVYGPAQTSGTRDALKELVLEAGCDTNPAMKALKAEDKDEHQKVCTEVRSDGAYVDQGEQDNLIVQKIESNPRSVGVFGFSYLDENVDKVQGLPMNGVDPTYDNIASFAYPGARPLYVYVKKAHMRAIPGLDLYLRQWVKDWNADGPLAKDGLVASPSEEMAANAAKVDELIVMTRSDLTGEPAPDAESDRMGAPTA